MKRISALWLALLLLLSLFGCSSDDAAKTDDPNLGVYKATTMTYSGFTMDVTDLFEDGFTIELKSNGKCTLTVDGDSANGKWTLDGTAFTVNGGGIDCTGTLKDGTMVLQYDEDTTITLVNDAYQTPAPQTAPEGASFSAPDKPAADSSASSDPAQTGAEPAAQQAKEYRLVSYSVDDGTGKTITFAAEDAGDLADTSLVLYPDQTAKLVLGGGDPFDLHWNEEGALTVGGEGYSMDFATFTRPDENSIDLNMYSVVYHLALAGTAPAPAAAVETSASSRADWWNGRWYGWLIFYEATGTYADWEDMVLDSVVDIDYEAGTLKLWGYLALDDEPLIDATVSFTDGTTPAGQMISTGGDALMSDLEYGDWIVDPGDSSVSVFDHMIEIIDDYEETEADGYTYLLYLRPWGMLWDDVETGVTEDMPYTDMMPNHYDWYLEQLGLAPAAPAEAPTAAPTEAPTAAPAAANNPGNGEPYGSSDGVIPHDRLAALYHWLSDMDSAFRRALTFDDLGNAVGKPGFDKQDGDGKYHAAYWYDGEKYYVTVTFYANDDGTWGVGSITTGIPSSEYKAADISGFPVIGNRAAGSSPVQSVTLENKVGFSGPTVAVTASVPTENWFAAVQSSSIRYNNAPSEKAANSNSPGIRVELKESLEKIDFYKDSFENLTELGTRTIGGVEMQARSYRYIGMDWVEYYGQIADGVWASVKTTGLDAYPGSEAEAILNSFSFALK